MKKAPMIHTKLRAERLGGSPHHDGEHPGRDYTLCASVADEAGNETAASIVVKVPHAPGREYQAVVDPRDERPEAEAARERPKK